MIISLFLHVQPKQQLHPDKYQLYLAAVVVTGGPNKIAGRSGSTILTEEDGIYTVQAEVFGNGIDMWLRSQESNITLL